MLTRTQQRIAVQLASNEGATAVEYAIMASLVAVVIVLAVAAMGARVSAIFGAAAAGF